MARQHALAAFGGRVVDHEKTTAESVDLPRELDAQLVPPDRDEAREHERDCLGARISRDGRGRPDVALDRGRGHGRVDCVEHEPVGGRRDLDVDHLGARERELLEVRPKVDRVMDRHHRLRQFAGRGGEGIRLLGAGAGGRNKERDQSPRDPAGRAVEQGSHDITIVCDCRHMGTQ